MKNHFLCLSACFCLLPLGCVQLSKTARQSATAQNANTSSATAPERLQQSNPDLSDANLVTTVAFTQRNDDEKDADDSASDADNAEEYNTDSVVRALWFC